MSEGFNPSSTECLDKVNYGTCTKGEDCQACNNINAKLDNLNFKDLQLNTGAKNYIPKSKRKDNTNVQAPANIENVNGLNEDKLNLNLDANEYIPKYMDVDYNQEEEDDVDLESEEFEMIVKDIIENEALEKEYEEDEESDEDKWFPKYKDCECCKGFVYKCTGTACKNMNMCYCKMKEECDDDDEYN